MRAKTLMIQGTGSSVGKSILVTALCRIFREDGLRVAPFKSQNMALNSFVTRDNGEMGRSQVVQAEAAGIEPTVDMNPILLKPEADSKSQVVVLGKPAMTLPAKEYYRHTAELLAVAAESLNRLRSSFDLVLIEGAGSPAEINLREREIVNMRIAKLAESPVLLLGDIDKGGVFASLVGTLALLDDDERGYIKGFIINKFRGDIEILKPGLEQLERLTGLPVVGVIPYYHDILIPEEDSIYRREGTRNNEIAGLVDIAVIRLPRISNSTDFELLQQEEGVRVSFIATAEELGYPDAIILPGTKSTISDLLHLQRTGLAEQIVQRAKGGAAVIGICGGFQMLGERIEDPCLAESPMGSIAGLGLLDIKTQFEPMKTTYQARARALSRAGLFQEMEGQEVTGYEIHMGQTDYLGAEPAFLITRRGDIETDFLDGAVSRDGRVFGTYLHGLFDSAAFRHALLNRLREGKRLAPLSPRPLPTREQQYDKLAGLVRESLDMELVYKICFEGGSL
jgi:adenosylcobyric acid synthase